MNNQKLDEKFALSFCGALNESTPRKSGRVELDTVYIPIKR